jgi:hypothetical protein
MVMQNGLLDSLRRLSDADLVAGVKGLVARERLAIAELVAHLAELDTRDVHLREGYRSLFVYCRDALGLSEAEAYTRIEVARAARRFPEILDRLAAGAVSLTAVRLLAPHLTPENHREALESARGKRKFEVEVIVAQLAPRPDVPFSVRPLPGPASSDLDLAAPLAPTPAPESAPARRPVEPTAVSVPPIRPPAVAPLAPDRYKLQVTISGGTLEKLRTAQDMLGHAVPSGDEAAIIDRAFDALLVELARKKCADTPRPGPSRGSKPGARRPSAEVKRAVWRRDLGRCAFVGPGGHRCDARRFLEFHHVDPYALGGEATVDQIQLRCRRHNDYEGRLYFGRRRRGELVPEQVEPRDAPKVRSRPAATPEGSGSARAHEEPGPRQTAT